MRFDSAGQTPCRHARARGAPGSPLAAPWQPRHVDTTSQEWAAVTTVAGDRRIVM